MQIALVTSKLHPDLLETDRNLINIFAEKRIIAEPVIWNNPDIDWTKFDYVIIRTTWDYFYHYTKFQYWLEDLEKNNIQVINHIHTIKKNVHKYYLRELQSRGVEIIPTLFVDKTDNLNLELFKSKLWRKNVIKPSFSADSYMTSVFTPDELKKVENEYKEIAVQRNLLIQPFMEEIVEMGEISMIFFNKQFSHSILKTPQKGDFRVQSDYGGTYKRYNPSKKMIETGKFILSCWDDDLLYARVDGILSKDKFLMMELELIEPDLYFEYCENAQQDFVESFCDYIKK